MDTSEALLTELEGLFIGEFRACQAVHNLTVSERQALSQGDVTRLPGLTEHKEDLLDKLSRLETTKYELLLQLGGRPSDTGQPEDPSNNLKTLNLIDFLSAIDQASAQRLLRIQEGSLILRAKVRDLARGNRALATGALQRTNSLQARLLRVYQLPERSKPARSDGANGPLADLVEPDGSTKKFSAVFASLITARDALHANDRKALTGALEDLQLALESLSGNSVGAEPVTDHPPKKPAPNEVAEAEDDPSLVETIASLYHQQTAYQASLKISNRMLASP